MEFRGVFEGGVIHPSGPVNLPEGTEVEFHPITNKNGATAGEATVDSWKARAINELAAEQGVRPVRSIDDLAVAWPDADPADSVDAFVRDLRGWRR